MNVPNDLLYATTHEWVRVDQTDSSLVTVGITDHAQAELTDIVYVEPPQVGSNVAAGSQAAVVESVKAASDIYSPVTGVVSEINEALVADPSLLNTDAFGDGWLFKVKLQDSEELKKLMTPDHYAEQIAL